MSHAAGWSAGNEAETNHLTQFWEDRINASNVSELLSSYSRQTLSISLSSCAVQVTDLRAQLGSQAVPCPQMDIGMSFASIANKALGIAGFFPYNTDTNFLLGEQHLLLPPKSMVQICKRKFLLMSETFAELA